jgi:hypothetical protein
MNAFYNAMQKLSTPVHVVIFIALILLLTALVIELVAPFKLTRRKRIGTVGAILALAVAICGILAATSFVGGPPSARKTQEHTGNSVSIRTFVTITVPQRALPGNPLSKVTCNQTISGTEQIPRDDTLVTGNRDITTPDDDWYFSQAAPSGGRWTDAVTFGDTDTANHKFELVAMAIPKDWELYVVSVDTTANSKAGGGFIDADMPPDRVDVFQETVQRSASPSCSHHG